jgi:hypothetical protein
MEKELNSPYIHLKIEDGVLIGTYKKGLKINIDIAKEIVNTRLDFTERKNLPALIFNQGVISMDKASREFLSSPEGIAGLKAAAIITDSAFSSFLGNFFLTVNKTAMPVKIFSTPQRALKWLKTFVI